MYLVRCCCSYLGGSPCQNILLSSSATIRILERRKVLVRLCGCCLRFPSDSPLRLRHSQRSFPMRTFVLIIIYSKLGVTNQRVWRCSSRSGRKIIPIVSDVLHLSNPPWPRHSYPLSKFFDFIMNPMI